MRLKSINIYSDYLGDPENTKARTGELRHDAEFLDYIFWEKVKYVDNAYLRQLNVCCSPFVQEICISAELTEGYPQISVPFDYSLYSVMSEEDKDLYWIDYIEKVFKYLASKMNSKDEKIKQYIEYLRSSDLKSYKQKVREAYEAWKKNSINNGS